MTYTMCPACGQHALKVANRCPRCGLAFEQQFLSRTQPQRSSRRLPAALLLGAVLVVMLVTGEWIKRRKAGPAAAPVTAALAPDTTTLAPAAAQVPADTPIASIESASRPTLRPPAAVPVTDAAGDGSHSAATWVNVRAEPNNGSAVVGVLQPGEVVQVDSSTQGWYRLAAGRVPAGYVDRRLVREQQP